MGFVTGEDLGGGPPMPTNCEASITVGRYYVPETPSVVENVVELLSFLQMVLVGLPLQSRTRRQSVYLYRAVAGGVA